MGIFKGIKKIIILLLIAFLSVITVAIIAKAIKDNFNENGGASEIIEIWSADELYKMKSDGEYILMNDIDLESNIWTPISIKSFNGNGYTIRNCSIIDTPKMINYYRNEPHDYTYVGFFQRVDTLENLTLENIDVTCFSRNVPVSCAAIAAGYSGNLVNICVKNSSISIIYSTSDETSKPIVSGICSWVSNAKNCKIENSSISITKSGLSNVMVGGAFGSIEGIVTNCLSDAVNINTSGNVTILSCGGIAGINSGKLKNSLVRNCSINALCHSNSFIGGLVGTVDSDFCEVISCESKNNTILLSTEKNDPTIMAGCFAGKAHSAISNCISSNNCVKFNDSTNGNGNIYLGGFIGSINEDGSVVSSMSMFNKVFNIDTEKAFTAGFAGKSNGAIVNSAVRESNISGGEIDHFAFSTAIIENCYVSNDTLNNRNSLPILNDEDWTSFDILKSKLRLSLQYWTFDSDLKLINTAKNI
ncbi:MAG: hypothetical protein IJY18_02650 [Clostridia bacterium]|nr:hypothetical protein [Clostridia bacterium]